MRQLLQLWQEQLALGCYPGGPLRHCEEVALDPVSESECCWARSASETQPVTEQVTSPPVSVPLHAGGSPLLAAGRSPAGTRPSGSLLTPLHSLVFPSGPKCCAGTVGYTQQCQGWAGPTPCVWAWCPKVCSHSKASTCPRPVSQEFHVDGMK